MLSAADKAQGGAKRGRPSSGLPKAPRRSKKAQLDCAEGDHEYKIDWEAARKSNSKAATRRCALCSHTNKDRMCSISDCQRRPLRYCSLCCHKL